MQNSQKVSGYFPIFKTFFLSPLKISTYKLAKFLVPILSSTTNTVSISMLIVFQLLFLFKIKFVKESVKDSFTFACEILKIIS